MFVRRSPRHDAKSIPETLPYHILIIEYFFGANLLPFPGVGSPVLHISHRGVR